MSAWTFLPLSHMLFSSASVTGTSRQGIIKISYKDLIATLGKPTFFESSDGKVRVRWILAIGQTMATIYDYKETCDLEEVTEWHIGGHSADAAVLVNRLLK